MVIFILTLPIDKTLKGQILAFLGIIISAEIALSSTTVLGDYSVVYKIHGFLEDSGKYFSTNSLLNAMVMGKQHAEKIEIKKDYLKEIEKKQANLKEKLKDLKDDKEVEKIKSVIKKNDELEERIEKNIQEQI